MTRLVTISFSRFATFREGIHNKLLGSPRLDSRFEIAPMHWTGPFLLFAMLLAGGIAHSQISLETGLTPFATYQAGGIDPIDIGSGGLHVHILLVSYPQRGNSLFLRLPL